MATADYINSHGEQITRLQVAIAAMDERVLRLERIVKRLLELLEEKEK
jgi:hypothetical protein